MLSLRRWGRRTGLPAAVGLGLVLLTACGGSSLPQAEGTGAVLRGGGPAPSTTGNPAATPRSVVLRTEGARQSPGVVAAGGPGAPYNYAPSVLRVGGRYRMWWCSQLPGAARPGDQILYADS